MDKAASKAPKPTGAGIALVGGEGLLGRELRELLESAALPARLKVLAGAPWADDASAKEGTGMLLETLESADLGGTALALLAGSEQSSREALGVFSKRRPAPRIVDLTGGLEENAAARLRAPAVETPGAAFPARAIHVVAHPAAIALALLLSRLHAAQALKRAVVTIFEPASERGQNGIHELHQQTVRLLAFQKLPKEVFDAQLSFNLLPEYGEDAPEALVRREERIERNLASLLAGAGSAPMPSLRLVQAPVFHGHSFSIWAEFESAPGIPAILTALAAEPQIDVRGEGHEAPTNAGVAGHGGVTVGSAALDRNHPRAAWFWMAADNLRIAASNAVEVARGLLG